MFIVRRTLLYFIPAIFLFVSNGRLKFIFSTDEETNDIIKIGLFIISCTISYLIVPSITERDKKRVQNLSSSVKSLLGILRKELSNELEKSFVMQGGAKKELKLNIRVFEPKRRSIKDLLKCKRQFQIKPYEGLHIREVENIAFLVAPKGSEQGLVGQVYSQKTFKYDFDLEENHSLEYYRLDANQLEATKYCNFAIAAPIFKGNSQKVIAIITFDSEMKVKHCKGNKWEDTIRTYCKIIHKVHNSIK